MTSDYPFPVVAPQGVRIISSMAEPFRTAEDGASRMNAREPLQDVEEIKTLKARYIRCGDTKRWDDLAELLT